MVANSGNGKTYLVSRLAEKFNTQLFRITPDDIKDKNDINNIIKSLNLYNPLEGGRNKIILIDDIDEFYYSFRNTLLKDIPRLSLNPVIFTSKTYKFPDEFKSHALKVGKRKSWYIDINPHYYHIYQLLKTYDTDLIDKELYHIAKHSPSVRSAILSLNGPINDIIETDEALWTMINTIKRKELKKHLTRMNRKVIFNSLNGCDFCSLPEFSSVVDRFLDLNERIVSKHETYDGVAEGVNCWFINHMKEPIEGVNVSYIFKKKNNNKVKKQVLEKKKEVKVKKKTQLDRWL